MNFTLEMSQGCQWGVHIQFLVNNLDSSQLPSMNLTRQAAQYVTFTCQVHFAGRLDSDSGGAGLNIRTWRL